MIWKILSEAIHIIRFQLPLFLFLFSTQLDLPFFFMTMMTIYSRICIFFFSSYIFVFLPGGDIQWRARNLNMNPHVVNTVFFCLFFYLTGLLAMVCFFLSTIFPFFFPSLLFPTTRDLRHHVFEVLFFFFFCLAYHGQSYCLWWL
jgi:hypothetical protein